MNLITIYAGAKEVDVSHQFLYKEKNKIPRPRYFHEMKGEIFIDTDNPAWVAYKTKRELKKMGQLRRLDKKSYEHLGRAVIDTLKEETDFPLDEIRRLANCMERRMGPYLLVDMKEK